MKGRQDSLFPEDGPGDASTADAAIADESRPGGQPAPGRRAQEVLPAEPGAEQQAWAARLPPTLHLGTSSWHFPGWKGLVWRGDHASATLSRHGLTAYGQHPLLRGVSLDRAFYRPLSALDYLRYAQQVPPHFRFIVKAPALVCDALVRGEQGQGRQLNTAFLDPTLAVQTFVEPAAEGLRDKAGALVFQISPLPGRWLRDMAALLQRLDGLLAAVRQALAPAGALHALAPGAVVAVEVRDAAFLQPDVAPAFIDTLRRHGATYCLGLHAKMPPIEDQLFVLRALWPGPLVCRWNLHRRHGAYGYEAARDLYEPFDRIQDPDPQTREHLARVIRATTARGLPALVTINNKAEGSAPLSVAELARCCLGLSPR
ncbi:MAG: DUF72 domain-containing protein [Comamonas sp.]